MGATAPTTRSSCTDCWHRERTVFISLHGVLSDEVLQLPMSFAERLRTQWTNPRDIFSILLLVGGEVVQGAIAQTITCDGLISPPVPFSFGWVAFAFQSLASASSRGQLMPRADYDCLCINLFDGTVRQNRSFALGRLLRDYEAWRHDPPTESEGYRLVVDIYESQERPEKLRSLRSRLSGKFLLDWTADNIANILCWVIVVVQLVLAILASVIQGNQRWDVLLVTGSGTFLSFATCQLPEWRREKFESRKLTKDQDIALTIGQGGRHVVILRSKEGDWDLQALSTAEASLPSLYRLGLGIAFLLWIALLITATSIDERSWYILGIGLLGMIGNAFLAGMKQRPGAWGFRHLVKVKQAPFSERKTMATLKAVEEYKQGFGCSLLPIFFEESSLSSQETQYWEPRMRRWKTNRRPGEPQEQERQGTMTQNIRDPDAATDQDQQWTASRIDQHSTVLIRPPSNHARQSNQSSSASTPNLADPRLPTESNELTRPETIA